ncbi:hypothetical protein BJY01DRAFT_259136 [Aspergillus pseudoustus]|uniref:Nucleoside phosphorylase domain-containing protein n=1 Tax=Aspergillus pseudoustus TaxID=1810923 RepID=A0ABR4J6B2_9EURO
MAPTVSPGWSALQTLRSRLSGRLERFGRSDGSTSGGRSQTAQNEAAFFEADLRYLFTTMPMVSTIPYGLEDSFERRAQDLMLVLDAIVNHDLVAALEALKTATPPNPKPSEEVAVLHDLAALGEQYPDIVSLLIVLETSTAKFNLATDRESSLFILPEGQDGQATMRCVTEVKELLSQALYDTNQQAISVTPPFPTEDDLSGTLGQPEGFQDPVPRRYASIILKNLFDHVKQKNCGKLHEMKLRVSNDWQTETRDVPLDMFLSCCLDEVRWHHAQCGPVQTELYQGRKDGICAAIQRARDQDRSIHLLVDKDGLSDISETRPAKHLSAADYTSETLQDLFNQNALTRITANDYRSGQLERKMSSREKAILALDLARCLLEFFDADIEHASHCWKPESVFFLRPSQGHSRPRILYISLRPCGGASLVEGSIRSVGAIGPGNPILLSFARLLLEIENGERIPMEIHADSRENLYTWGEMCDIVERVERERGSNYLRAVEGCLYLHMAVRKFQHNSDHMSLNDHLRRAIYDQVVRNLEVDVNPQDTKRKRRDSVSELPLSKKLSIASPAPEPYGSPAQTPSSRENHPDDRNDFEIAIVCALPLEFDAIYSLLDEVWDKDYGRIRGDENIYTHGRMGKFNIVLLVLPSMGKVSAATTTTSLRLSYQRLSLVLVTGICGGVPFPNTGDEIVLGDVVISRHVVQYDLGRQYPDEFEVKDTVEDRFGRAPPNTRHLLAILQTLRAREKMESLAASYLEDIQRKAARKPRGSKYLYPGASDDQLFEPSYQHRQDLSPSPSLNASKKKIRGSSESSGISCDQAGCGVDKMIRRERVEQKKDLEKQGQTTEAQVPLIFLGTIGSADTVMKSAEERDRIASQHGLIAFEMEGAGIWDETPCIIVKGVCDYADSHKNKNWQDFAAATAASATKALLDFYVPRRSSK